MSTPTAGGSNTGGGNSAGGSNSVTAGSGPIGEGGAGQGGLSSGGAAGSAAGTANAGQPSSLCEIPCRPDQVCLGGQCRCPIPGEECDGVCVNTDTDPQHCGTCENACGVDQVCDARSCVAGCSSGRISCSDACINPSEDRDFCGASGDCMGTARGTQCRADQICNGGQCRCEEGFQECGDTCVNINLHPLHCGACGVACGVVANTTAVCSGGSCTCTSGWEDCDALPGCESEIYDPPDFEWACGVSVSHDRRMFVTSQAYRGDFGGRAGADAICQALRVEEEAFYVAWLSTSDASAAESLVHGTGEYISGGIQIENWDDLVDGNLGNNFLWQLEGFQTLSYETQPFYIWTGTDASGQTVPNATCNDWTATAGKGAVGDHRARDASWTFATDSPTGGLDDCSESRRLLCVWSGVRP